MRIFAKPVLLLALLVPVTFVTACSSPATPSIVVNESTVFIDVRSSDEFAKSRIQGAYNIDFASENVFSTLSGLSRSRQYVLYGSNGEALQKAYDTMVSEGFVDVTLAGSMDTASRATGIPIE
jgi:rhodanese-related sulfurtransferase